MAKQQLSYDDQLWLEHFAKQLRTVLKTHSLSQNRAANLLGITRSRMSQLTSDSPQNPVGILLFRKICFTFKIDPNFFLVVPKEDI